MLKKLLIMTIGACALVASLAIETEEANAVVCARGVYRAGCVGPHGAVGVRRAPVYRHRPVVVRTRRF
jgi:hypothetical protein